MDYKALREEAYEANMELSRRALVLYTWGNVSAFDADKGVFAIKPSGVPYEQLRSEDIVVVECGSGSVIAGKLRPSSDTPTHLALYRTWGSEGVRGVTHTHSTYAVSWAQAGREIPVFGTTHADFSAAPIPCFGPLTERQTQEDYEGNTGLLITEGFAELGYRPLETPAALASGHGPFTWGRSAASSVEAAVILEEIAKMASLTVSIRHDAPLLPTHILRKHYERKHGKNAYYGQTARH